MAARKNCGRTGTELPARARGWPRPGKSLLRRFVRLIDVANRPSWKKLRARFAAFSHGRCEKGHREEFEMLSVSVGALIIAIDGDQQQELDQGRRRVP